MSNDGYMIIDDEDLYPASQLEHINQVECVLDHRQGYPEDEYLVKWLNRPHSENSWELESRLYDYIQLLLQYYKRRILVDPKYYL